MTLHRLGPNEPVVSKLVYFVRVNPKGVSEKTVEQDVISGEISGTALQNFRAIISELYLPIIQESQQWGKLGGPDAPGIKEFIGTATKFGAMLTEALATVNGGVELKKPDAAIVNSIELKPASYVHALSDESISQTLDECLTDWCVETERLLNQSTKTKDGGEPGPDTELEYWRSRMANLNSITEQLKLKECKVVLGVCGHAKSSSYIRWKALDVRVTDAANEAKDNVKYLATLEKSLEPMFVGKVEVSDISLKLA